MISQWIERGTEFSDKAKTRRRSSVFHIGYIHIKYILILLFLWTTKFDLLFLANPFCAQHFKAWMWARTKVRRASLKHRRAPVIAEIPPNGYHNLEPCWPSSYRNEGISRKFSMCSPLFEAFQHRSTGSGEICFFCHSNVPRQCPQLGRRAWAMWRSSSNLQAPDLVMELLWKQSWEYLKTTRIFRSCWDDTTCSRGDRLHDALIYIYRSSFHFPCRFSDFCNSNLDGGSFSPGGEFGVRQLLTCIQVVSLSAFASGWCLCRVCLKLSVYINLWYFWAFCAIHRPVPVQALGSPKQRAPEILPGFRRWNGGDGWIRLPERSSVTWFPACSSIFTFKGPWIPWIGSESTIHHSIFCGMSISASSWKMLPAILVTRKLGFWPIPELFF